MNAASPSAKGTLALLEAGAAIVGYYYLMLREKESRQKGDMAPFQNVLASKNRLNALPETKTIVDYQLIIVSSPVFDPSL